jgi:hypothetical protein
VNASKRAVPRASKTRSARFRARAKLEARGSAREQNSKRAVPRASKTMKRTGLVLFTLGLLASAGGIGWAVLFIGVPYPDPMPVQRAEEAFHLQVSNHSLLVGLGALAAACAVFVLRAMLGLLKR